MFKRIPNNVLRLNLFKNFVNKFSTNKPSSQQFNELFTNEFDVDIEFFQNVKNQQRILDNIRDREMIDNFPELFADNLDSKQLGNRLIEISRTLPNDFHPIWYDIIEISL